MISKRQKLLVSNTGTILLYPDQKRRDWSDSQSEKVHIHLTKHACFIATPWPHRCVLSLSHALSLSYACCLAVYFTPGLHTCIALQVDCHQWSVNSLSDLQPSQWIVTVNKSTSGQMWMCACRTPSPIRDKELVQCRKHVCNTLGNET